MTPQTTMDPLTAANPGSHSTTFKRRRKFFMILPLPAIFILIGLFWKLDGGKDASLQNQGKDSLSRKNLNTTLPDPHFKPGPPENKLSMYTHLQEDSLKRMEEQKKDPYYRSDSSHADPPGFPHPTFSNTNPTGSPSRNPYPPGPTVGSPPRALGITPASNGDQNAAMAKVREKLALLQRALQQPPGNAVPIDNAAKVPLTGPHAYPDRGSTPAPNAASDPEIAELNKMLDKILTIQHPERSAGTNRQPHPPDAPEGFPITAPHPDSSWQAAQTGTKGFYGLDNASGSIPNEAGALPGGLEAFILETQTLTAGSTVKLQLGADVYVREMLFPKGSWLYGTASLDNERCRISIRSIRRDAAMLPVSLEVYDLDGLEGIYMPGSLGRESGRQSADQAVNGIGITGLDPSLGAQAANAGIQTARTLLGRKIRRIQVTVKAGYRVWLRDNHR